MPPKLLKIKEEFKRPFPCSMELRHLAVWFQRALASKDSRWHPKGRTSPTRSSWLPVSKSPAGLGVQDVFTMPRSLSSRPPVGEGDAYEFELAA
jgi:hypothetical protein